MKIKVLIFEDEKYAAEQISDLLFQYDSEIEIVEIIDTVKGGIEWFKVNNAPDLILMDIQLADGISFEIFDYFKVNAPIIFTTAYDEYAIKAFKVNSIDYILKPIDYGDLSRALDKFKALNYKVETDSLNQLQTQINNLVESVPKQYQQRFLIHVADKFHIVNTCDILYFYIEENSVFLTDINGQSYSLDYTLDKVHKMLNPDEFFRINRKYIIHLNSIEKMTSYSQYRIKIRLKNCKDDDIIVSRERVKDFKDWLEK
ncbi:LytR/AlgR family response regulator transcription factor [Bacteroidota bacterium]